jgi:hypothetical protein
VVIPDAIRGGGTGAGTPPVVIPDAIRGGGTGASTTDAGRITVAFVVDGRTRLGFPPVVVVVEGRRWLVL